MGPLFMQRFIECIPQLHRLLSTVAREEIEWILASREEVLYLTPGAETETGIVLGMSSEQNPWFQEIFQGKSRVEKRQKGWRGDPERLSSVVGVPFLDESGEVLGAFLYITGYYNNLKADDILSLIQEMTREENLNTALNIFTRRSLEVFGVSIAGIWLWQERKYELFSIHALDEEQVRFVKGKEFPTDFGITWIQGPKIPECSSFDAVRRDLRKITEPWVKPFQDFGLQTLLCMPLIHFGQPLGHIVLFGMERDDIGEDSVYWLRQAVPLVSSFVYEQQLRLAAIDREQALTLLLRGTEILVQAETEEQLLTEAGEMAMEILFLPGGFFFLLEDGEWHIRAPFGRLKQTEWDWENWVREQMNRNEHGHSPHQQATLHFLEVEENPYHWGKVLIQPILTHSGAIGELWLMDSLEWIADQRQEILAAFVRGVAVALDAIRQRDELAHLASTDRLTGILNRQGFEQRIREEMAGTLRRDSSFLLLILDLDFFKLLNDTQGHPIGDRALRMIAQNLRTSVREQDIVARTGGDEFTVVLTDVRRSPEAWQVIERMKNTLNLEKFGLGVSIGVAEFPAEGQDYEELYRLADQRLYDGKNSGKGQIVFS